MHAAPNLYLRLSEIYNSFLWKNERQAEKGKFTPESSRQSVIFFSYYRSGSMVFGRIMNELLNSVDLERLDFASYRAKQMKKVSADFSKEDFGHYLIDRGVLHSVFRKPSFEYEVKKFKTVLLLRDPRDAIVSHYLSIKNAHTFNNTENIEMWKDVSNIGVDEWVLEHSKTYRKDLESYIDFIKESKEDIFFFLYEEMVSDFTELLPRICDYLEIDSSKLDMGKVMEIADFKPSAENNLAHKRSAKPGGHKKKLKPETIESLNKEFGKILDEYWNL
jgi:hypothetical protein